MERKELLMLNPREYEHPWDKNFSGTLEDIQGIGKIS